MAYSPIDQSKESLLNGGSRSSSEDDEQYVRGYRPKSSGSRILITTLIGLLATSCGLNGYLGWRVLNTKETRPLGDSLTRYEFDQPYTHLTSTSYNSENWTLADKMWDDIPTGPVTIAVPEDKIAEFGLQDTQRFPWDQSKGLYYVKGLHQIHCLRIARDHLLKLERGQPTTMPLMHIMHCFESLRQDVKCYADDRLMPAVPGDHIGNNHHIQCRNWDAMLEWAEQDDFDACWDYGDKYRPSIHVLERFRFCKSTSKYYEKMRKYFDIHGHKPQYDEGDKPVTMPEWPAVGS